MTAFSVSNGVVYADGQPIMPKLAYFENEGWTTTTKLDSFLNARADGTDLKTMRYNMVFGVMLDNNAVTTAMLDKLASKGMWFIGQPGQAGSGNNYPAFMTTYKTHPAFAGFIGNYVRQEDYKTPSGYATGLVYPYFDDINNAQTRQTANKGYKTGTASSLIKFGPQSGLPPVPRNGVQTVANESQKGPNNAKYAHENTRYYIGSDKLTFATFYAWLNDTRFPYPNFTEDAPGGTSNPILGYKNFKVGWNISGYQVYGVGKNPAASDYLYYFVRPYAGIKALIQNHITNGQLITCPMAILGCYTSDWNMPTAPQLRNQIYQAIAGGAKALGYYTYVNYNASNPAWTSDLGIVTPDRRLEIGYCHEELSLRAFTASGQRDGETYEKHVLTGVHTYHTCSGNPAIPTQGTVEGAPAEPFVVAASWVLGTTKFIVVVNRHPSTSYSNVTFRLDQGTAFFGIRHTGANYNLAYAGLARKAPTGTVTLGTDGVTVTISSIAGAEVVLLQTTTVTGSSGGDPTPVTAGRSSLVVKSTNLATANTNGPTDLGNAADTATWSSTTARAFTVYNRGQLDLWSGTTAYALNKQVRSSAGRWYVATVGGTSSSTEPTHTSGTAADGTVTWLYLGTVSSATYYIADASLTAAQKAAVDARSYLINYHYERTTQGRLTGSTSRYARTKAAENFTYSQIRDDCAAQEFDPTAYGTVLGYYDFGALDKITSATGAIGVNGDGVDKVVALGGSAFGDLRQTTDSLRPVLQGKQLNGRSVLSWQGVDNNLYMSWPSGRGAIKNLGGVTIVTVFKLSAVGANQRLFTITTADGTASRCIMVIDSANKILIGGRRQTSAEVFNQVVGATALSIDTWYIVAATYNYSTRAGQIWLNNVSDGTGNICATAGLIDNTDSANDPILGRDAAAAQDFQGYIACWGAFSGVLATQELSALYHYYKTIYGL